MVFGVGLVMVVLGFSAYVFMFEKKYPIAKQVAANAIVCGMAP